MTSTDFFIRPIQFNDNQSVAQLIKTVMTSFGAVGTGFSIEDPEVENMFDAYQSAKSAYFVITDTVGAIVGAGGFAPLRGGDADTCELKKMYFYPHARGKGLGQKLIKILENTAATAGFKKMYLETLANMTQANALYQKRGFQSLPKALGNTGHTGCGLFYLKDLSV